MDFVGPYRYESNGQPTADDSAKGLAIWSSHHGPMKALVTDRGPHFMGANFAQEAVSLGIIHHPTTTSHHPQANGYAELAGRRIKERSRSMLIENNLKESEVERLYGDIFLSLNSTKTALNSNIAPLEAMTLRPVNTNLELTLNPESDVLFMERLDSTEENLLHRFKVMSAAERDRYGTRRQIIKARKQAHLDEIKSTSPSDQVIKARCFVLVKDPDGKKPSGVGISPMYRGPFIVSSDYGNGDYLLQNIIDVKKTKLANVKDLKWFAPPMNGPTKDMRELAALTNTFLYNVQQFDDIKETKDGFFFLVGWEGYDDSTWEPLHNLWIDVPGKVSAYIANLPTRFKKLKPRLMQILKNWGVEQEEGSVEF